MAISINKPCCMLRIIDLDSMLHLRTVPGIRHHFLCICKPMQCQALTHTVCIPIIRIIPISSRIANTAQRWWVENIIVNKIFGRSHRIYSNVWVNGNSILVGWKRKKNRKKNRAIEIYNQRKLKEEKRKHTIKAIIVKFYSHSFR